ncbi:MAG: Rpn family recombination-promoting nuclease/putative transposase [Bacteroidetes bacterium]|nr:Rpn family recombination-promoting nuclease/putative transposase [Bacteroidota bacterium]
MGKLVHEPFDKLVKATLHNIERAKEFLEAHLSQKAKKGIVNLV